MYCKMYVVDTLNTCRVSFEIKLHQMIKECKIILICCSRFRLTITK
jgi:hypothetical protein